MITRLSGEVGEPRCLWLMRRGAGGTSDAVQILAAWITNKAVGFGSKGSIVRNVTGGKTGQNNLSTINTDGRPLIIQHSYASGGEEIKIILVHHPLMIAEGEKGRGDGGAGAEEVENVGLGSHRTRIIFRLAAV